MYGVMCYTAKLPLGAGLIRAIYVDVSDIDAFT